jgi:hypothetical protein
VEHEKIHGRTKVNKGERNKGGSALENLLAGNQLLYNETKYGNGGKSTIIQLLIHQQKKEIEQLIRNLTFVLLKASEIL